MGFSLAKVPVFQYLGTPLQMDDEVLRKDRGWLKRHDLTVVKLDSKQRVGVEDVWPSFIAISWHGADYETPLKQRTQECKEFFGFLSMLREKNWNIPILIGGDFNMDMKSFNMKSNPEFVLVPYRPVSGALAKDLKNTFMFTMDSLQVTETSFRQHHPEIFPTPFIGAKVRGKYQIRIWAVVRIQRVVRKWLRRKRERQAAMMKQIDSKRRWRKKIGADYDSEDEDRYRVKQVSAKPRSRDDTDVPKSKKAALVKATRKDRRYALYWDETDDPRYQEEKKENSRSHEERRNKDFNQNSGNVMDNFYTSDGIKLQQAGHRRRRFDDLKSVQDRKKEAMLTEAMYRNGL